jgi:hypothetical protein
MMNEGLLSGLVGWKVALAYRGFGLAVTNQPLHCPLFITNVADGTHRLKRGGQTHHGCRTTLRGIAFDGGKRIKKSRFRSMVQRPGRRLNEALKLNFDGRINCRRHSPAQLME